MKTEYILYIALVVVTISFIMLLWLLLQNTKKNIINSKIRKCIEDKIHQKVSAYEVEKMINYIEKNKKHVFFSTYTSSLHTLRRALVKINY